MLTTKFVSRICTCASFLIPALHGIAQADSVNKITSADTMETSRATVLPTKTSIKAYSYYQDFNKDFMRGQKMPMITYRSNTSNYKAPCIILNIVGEALFTFFGDRTRHDYDPQRP